jgi:general secretion pathway protein B
MSFILNALRKSEQERQALHAEIVNDRILLPQPQPNHGKTKFFAFLIFGNLLLVACIVWFIRNDFAPTPQTTAQTVSTPLPIQETKLESKPVIKPAQPEKPTQKAEFDTTSIAELVETQKPASAPAPLPVKQPIITKNPVPDVIKQPAIDYPIEKPIQQAPAIPEPVKVQPATPETIAIKKDIPLLSDLSVEFRQSIPKFTINVFVYSHRAEERFVMIDMVKYKPGDKIKDEMELKEIRPVSLVVVYQNRTFQIERP